MKGRRTACWIPNFGGRERDLAPDGKFAWLSRLWWTCRRRPSLRTKSQSSSTSSTNCAGRVPLGRQLDKSSVHGYIELQTEPVWLLAFDSALLILPGMNTILSYFRVATASASRRLGVRTVVTVTCIGCKGSPVRLRTSRIGFSPYVLLNAKRSQLARKVSCSRSCSCWFPRGSNSRHETPPAAQIGRHSSNKPVLGRNRARQIFDTLQVQLSDIVCG